MDLATKLTIWQDDLDEQKKNLLNLAHEHKCAIKLLEAVATHETMAYAEAVAAKFELEQRITELVTWVLEAEDRINDAAR